MVSSNRFASTLNGRPNWQCRYSGCTRPRHMRPNSILLRFCNYHRLRQNEHQRAFVQRRRREQHQRLSRMCVMPTGDVFVQMELDEVFDAFDFGRDFDGIEGVRLVDNLQSLLDDSIASSDSSNSPLNELIVLPVVNIDELLDYLLTPDS